MLSQYIVLDLTGLHVVHTELYWVSLVSVFGTTGLLCWVSLVFVLGLTGLHVGSQWPVLDINGLCWFTMVCVGSY